MHTVRLKVNDQTELEVTIDAPQPNTVTTQSPDNSARDLALLQNYSNLRSAQDQVLWSIIGAFWTANSVFLIGIFTADKDKHPFAGLFISLVAFFISSVWFLIQQRALRWIVRYEELIQNLERRLALEDVLRRTPSNNNNVNEILTARNVMRFFSRAAIVCWLASLLFFIVKLILDNNKNCC